MTTKERIDLQANLLTEAHHNYKKELLSCAFFKISNREMSEDLVQNTFIKTWKYITKGGEIEIMKVFLYHVLNGLIIDEYRKHKSDSLDNLMEKGFEPSMDESERLLDVLDGKSAILLIEKLPEKYRKVLYLRYVKLLSLKEISLLTDKSINTVTVQAHRGLDQLRSLYNHKLKIKNPS